MSNIVDEAATDRRVEEVTCLNSPHLAQMSECFRETFPQYGEPYFPVILKDPDSHDARLFVALSGDQVAGLTQVFYRRYGSGLIAWIDVVGVRAQYRCSGFGTALIESTLDSLQQQADGLSLTPLGTVSLVDPLNEAAMALHAKRGQIRDNICYACDDPDTPTHSLFE